MKIPIGFAMSAASILPMRSMRKAAIFAPRAVFLMKLNFTMRIAMSSHCDWSCFGRPEHYDDYECKGGNYSENPGSPCNEYDRCHYYAEHDGVEQCSECGKMFNVDELPLGPYFTSTSVCVSCVLENSDSVDFVCKECGELYNSDDGDYGLCPECCAVVEEYNSL